MIVTQGSHLHFETAQDDSYTATVTGPGGYSKEVRAKEILETGRRGFFALRVTDSAVRDRNVTLTGTGAVPPVENGSGTSVTFEYEVR